MPSPSRLAAGWPTWGKRLPEGGQVLDFEPIEVLEGSSFMLSDRRGDVLEGSIAGFFHEDTRYLNRFVLTVGGTAPSVLTSGSVDAFKIVPRIKNVADQGYAERLNEAAVWITADERRLPVMLRSKIIFGSIYMELADDTTATRSTVAENPPSS